MIKVKLVRSKIGCKPDQRKTLEAMGLKRLHQVRTLQDNAAVRGMIKKIEHMLEVVS